MIKQGSLNRRIGITRKSTSLLESHALPITFIIWEDRDCCWSRLLREAKMSLLINLFTVYSLLFVYTGVIVGCIRKSDNSNRAKIDNKIKTQIILENYRLSCSDNETKALACLNGGSCFVVYVEDRIVKCACSNKYIGKRCEMIDPEIIFRQSETEGNDTRNGFIIGFIVIIILLLIALLILICLNKDRLKKHCNKVIGCDKKEKDSPPESEICIPLKDSAETHSTDRTNISP